MESSPLFWLAIMLLCILTQGIYSMIEMAAVSFNRVRLEYYVSKGMKRAEWLEFLLKKPSRLFGTVMLGVNIALQLGSQCSREFYRSIGLNPDFAPVTQVFLVVIIAELAPLFAARRYAEHVVMLGVPIVYGTYRLLSPIIALIGFLTKGVARLFVKKAEQYDAFLTRDELLKILETHDEAVSEGEEFHYIASNIFTLKNKNAIDIMTPLAEVELLRANATIKELKELWQRHSTPFMPLYHKQKTQIVAIAMPKDLVRGQESKSVRDLARPPWFITQETDLIHILKQFRQNRQEVAVVLNPQGHAVGIVTLDAILGDLFGETKTAAPERLLAPVIERTFPGETKIVDFNREYGASIEGDEEETLADLVARAFDHTPEPGESVVIEHFEFIVEEASLLGIKKITVKSTF